MFETIVAGFDGSETSEHAMQLACDLAQKYKSELHLVHTPQPQTVAFAMGAVAGYHTVTTMPPMEDVKSGSAKIVAAGREIAAKSGMEIPNAHIKVGEPGDVIVRYAEKCGAGLIVTGRRGLGALGAMVQGSTSLRVNHLAKCPVLTVI
jgi:nucleotide-binding universal stress UspA family protein